MSQRGTASPLNTLRHHAITGPSAAVLQDFYAYFGFTQLVVEESPNSDYIKSLSGGAWSWARILKLRNAVGDVLEIIEPSDSSVEATFGGAGNWSHFAFTVHNCDDAVRDVLAMGGQLVGGPVINPDAPYKVAYVRDPAQNLIELVEGLS
jgi:catechol 2,3-dioxygenase-like lactoylglutathione lyase family enzyme